MVIGVHSPKFPHEGRHASVRRAVARLGHRPSRARRPRHGHLAAVRGAGLAHGGRGRPGRQRRRGHDRRGQPPAAAADGGGHDRPSTRPPRQRRRRPLDLEPPRPPPGSLAFPGKVATTGAGRLADRRHRATTGCWSCWTLRGRPAPAEGTRRITHIVSGLRRPPRGSASTAGAVHLRHRPRPAGPHRPRRPARPDEEVEPDSGRHHPAAGPHRRPARPDLASPWDVTADVDRSLVVAEAGRNRLWRVPAGRHGPGDHRRHPLRGLRRRSRPPMPNWPSPAGLTRVPSGIVFVDAESSALRILTTSGRVSTLVGEGLFDWGRRDGRRRRAASSIPKVWPPRSTGGSSTWSTPTTRGSAPWQRNRLRTVRVDPDRPTSAACWSPAASTCCPTAAWSWPIPATTGWWSIDPVSGRLEPLELEATRVPALPSPVSRGAPAVGGARPAVPAPLRRRPRPLRARPRGRTGPVRIVVDAQPAWLLDHGPRVWRHVEPAGRLRAAGRFGRRGLAGRDGDGRAPRATASRPSASSWTLPRPRRTGALNRGGGRSGARG